MIGITFVVCLTIGIFAVFVIQNTVRPGEKSAEYSPHGEVVQTSTTSANRIPTTDRIDVGQFQEIFKQDSISEQYSVLHATLSQATEQELADWWNQSKSIERASQREIAQQVILRSLTAINPQEAFRRIDEVSILQSEVALKIVFNEWAGLHLEDAIKTASSIVSSQRNVALQTILETRDDLPENELLSIARRLF